MRRFVTLVILLLFSIPFGVSISGCSKKTPPVFCNNGDSGLTAGQATTISLTPIVFGISLNFAQIGQVNTPAVTDCKGSSVTVQSLTYGTSDMTIADVQPNTGRLCGGTWNRNTGGGIADYTVCNPTGKSGTAYVSVSAQGVTSNPLPVFVHPVVTSIVLGGASQAGAAAVTAWSIVNTSNPQNPLVNLTAQNSFSAGQTISLSNFPTSTFFNGITNAVVQAAGLSSTQFTVSIPGLTQLNSSATETGLATGPGCTTDPSTACCPLTTVGSPTAQPYLANDCVSQGTTAQLVARIFSGTGKDQTNISCQAGHLQFAAQGSSNQSSASQVVTIDANGVATANQPGSVLISANIANAASSAGFFSTCPPKSITLTAPGTTTDPVVINQNNIQPLLATAIDTKGVPLTGLALEYVSTSPTTIPAGAAGSVTPPLAGATAISAICQPPSCNSSAYNQIGLFGNGKPVTSNSVNFVAPGTNSTVLYMASTQSQYVVSKDFTQTLAAAPVLLPFLPNSMVITNDGTTIYMGSATGLMVLSAQNTLNVTRTDITQPGTVLAVSPSGGVLVIDDPVKQLITLEAPSGSGSVISTYGANCPVSPPPAISLCHAEFAPDSNTLYIAAGDQLLVYSSYTGWTNITSSTPESPLVTPVTDVAITVPSVGAYFAGSTTTARSYCAVTTPTATPTVENNFFYPSASDDAPVITDRIAATNDGKHIVGATASGNTLSDLTVTLPTDIVNGLSVPQACPEVGTQRFSNLPPIIVGMPIAATAITGVLPTSDSKLVFITYTGSGGVLPAYSPALGTVNNIPLVPAAGTPTPPLPIAPIAGVLSADNSMLFAGTLGDNLVHLITITPGTPDTAADTSTLSPNLTSPLGISIPGVVPGAAVPVNLLVQKPRKST